MSTLKHSPHPFFQRLVQRESIIEHISVDSLFLQADSSKSEFKSVLSKKGEEEQQFNEFTDPSKNYPYLFADLLSQSTSADLSSRLFAFLDGILDYNFNLVLDVLVPHAKALTSSCIILLRQYVDSLGEKQFLIRTALLLVGAIVGDDRVPPDNDTYSAFSNITISVLNLKRLPESAIGLEGLKRSLKSSMFRSFFIDHHGHESLPAIIDLAFTQNNFDTLYHSLFCVWALSFTSYRLEIPDLLAKLLSNIQPEREDIVRILFLIIQKHITFNSFVEQAYDLDLIKYLIVFKGKHYVDKEILNLVNQVCTDLHEHLKKISLWERYSREVNSGKLKFTLSHHSEAFWKVNIERFGESNFSTLVNLTHLLESDDDETITVALHDIGEYIMRHPLGRKKIEEIGAKEIVLRLLNHKNPQIQREALRTTQHLLLKSS